MPDTKTYRGRSLEEVIPKIRAELGPDAVVLTRREGLAGGVGGFFQHSYIEVEARGPVQDPELAVRSDRATAEGLSAPGIQALLAQASPFADQLAAAQERSGLYGPQPVVEAAPEPQREAPAFVAEVLPREPVPVAPAALLPAPAPALPVPEIMPTTTPPPATEPLQSALTRAGLTAELAAEVVDEAVRHGLPFTGPDGLKGVVRSALADRIPTLGRLGQGSRTVAIVGPAGAGKTTAATRLAAAYRDAGAAVRQLPAGDPRCREPFEGLTVIDAPPTGVRDGARVRELVKALRGLKAEVHLALPATLSLAAIEDLVEVLAPLKPTHVLLTHASETAHPGAPVAHAIATGRRLSYVSGAEVLVPANAAVLAKRLVP